jgi:hypothetical protein
MIEVRKEKGIKLFYTSSYIFGNKKVASIGSIVYSEQKNIYYFRSNIFVRGMGSIVMGDIIRILDRENANLKDKESK